MYEYKTILPSPFTDKDYYFSPEFAFYYIQEVAGRHMMKYGTGIPHLLKEDKSWVLLHTHLEFCKKVYWQTPLSLKTFAFEPKGITVPRVVECRTDNGDMVFSSYSLWGVVEAKNGVHHLINPRGVTDRVGYDDEKPFKMPPRLKKIDNLEKLQLIKSENRTIHYNDIDINGHVNNLKYSSWIVSSLSENDFLNDNSIQEMDILFSKELRLNDEVTVSLYKNLDDSYYASINDAAFASIKIGKVDKETHGF